MNLVISYVLTYPQTALAVSLFFLGLGVVQAQYAFTSRICGSLDFDSLDEVSVLFHRSDSAFSFTIVFAWLALAMAGGSLALCAAGVALFP